MQRATLRARQIKIVLAILAFVALNFIAERLTTKEFSRFMKGNDQIISDMHFRDKLNDLRNDILLIESRVRGLVVTDQAEFASDIDREFQRAYEDLDSILAKTKKNPAMQEIGDSLNVKIRNKIEFNKKILSIYEQQGKESAARFIGTGTGRALRQDIFDLTGRLNSFTRDEINRLEHSVAVQGEKTKILEQVLPIVSTVVICLLSFFLIANIRSQERLYRESMKSVEKERSAYLIKEQFIANISHEIRTPLNSVIGYCNLLLKTELSHMQRKFVDAVQTSGESLLHIINELLDFGKMQEGTLVLKKQNFNLSSLLREVRMMFNEAFNKKGVSFEVQSNAIVHAELQGDETKLRQVLVNLINNALKFTSQGYVTVTVNEHPLQSPNQVNLVFEVADTGIGIAAENQTKVFERFYQVESSLDRKFGGTGLGLAITHQLVTLMGGKISLQSELGRGSTFTVEIPFDLTLPDASTRQTLAVSIPESTNKRVLVVDDNSLNSELTAHVLKGWNFDVETVDKGSKAIEKLKKQNFDLVLMDIQMPDMDGYETTREIRETLNMKVPIIALTAHSNATERQRCLEAGMDEYISKPFDELQLFGLLTKVITPSKIVTFDLTYLQNLSKGNKQFEKRILEKFVEETPVQLEQLNQAIQKKNARMSAAIVHILKANVAIVGLESSLAPRFEKLHAAIAAGETESALQNFAEINSRIVACMNDIPLIS